MDLAIEINKLRAYMDKHDTEGFKAYLKTLYGKSNPEEKDAISLFVETELKKSTERIKNTIDDIQIRIQLESIIDILPLSYISEKYFYIRPYSTVIFDTGMYGFSRNPHSRIYISISPSNQK
jgi:hypothetical protein